MASNDDSMHFSDVVLEAVNLLLQYRLVEITAPLEHIGDRSGWQFRCIMPIPQPNKENLPARVELLVKIPEAYPYAAIEFIVLSDDVKGFPHQSADGGLCFPDKSLAPYDARRLVHYTIWAKDWLEKAANNTLVEATDPYELPAFALAVFPKKYGPILVSESASSYDSWRHHIGATGTVEFLIGTDIRAILATRFLDATGRVVREPEFRRSQGDTSPQQINGRWILLPKIVVKHHQPPQTYGQLEKLAKDSDIDLYQVIGDAWRMNHSADFAIVLIGFPIPKTFGGKNLEIHWQPLVFPNLRAITRSKTRSKKGRPAGKRRNKKRSPQKISKFLERTLSNRLWYQNSFTEDDVLPWSLVENAAEERLHSRGGCAAELRTKKIAVMGCGALGGSIAELLVRGGATWVDVFDSDIFEAGNLCRHSLDGFHLGLMKGTGLAQRLSSINPFARISGHKVNFPPDESLSNPAEQAIGFADIFIDVTTDSVAFQWLSQLAFNLKKQMISAFFDFNATHLTVCISGGGLSCSDVFNRLKGQILAGEVPIAAENYFYEPRDDEQVRAGIGCWHATFPAPFFHIQQLAASAVEIINAYITNKEDRGIAVVVRRRSLSEELFASQPLVELLCVQVYP